MDALGWDELDVLLVSGDAYVDSHSFGASLLGRWLVEHGFKTGIIAQPAWDKPDDVLRMGRPRLFAGVSAGSVDSLVAHYTAFRKKRSEDAFSPGGKTGLRPNRAVIAYTGLVRQAFPNLPVVAGGIEASLRRASQYDFWSDSLRRSIVLDSKADAVLFGMAEKSIVELAKLFRDNPTRIRPADALVRARLNGVAYAVHPDAIPADAVELPSHEAILADPALLIKATRLFEEQMLQGGPCLVQRSGGRAIVFEKPSPILSEQEMDRLYGLPFTRLAHPSYQEEVPAVAMIAESIVSHRGCGGGCSFCALALHQGRAVQSRSAQSICDEVARLTARPDWKGSITDIGGPSSNMWNARCEGDPAACKRDSCVSPKRCRYFRLDQEGQVELLRHVAKMDGVNHVRVASGVRHDLAIESDVYMQALVGEFTGGQLKIAPEHIVEKVLRMMRKTPKRSWETFIKAFERLSAEAGKEQYIVPYLMSAFPGCTDDDMAELGVWLRRRDWRPQQVQCFIPTPGTLATAMFFAGQDVDGRPIFVARTDGQRLFQHRILIPEAEPAPVRSRPAPGKFQRHDSRGRPNRSGGPRSGGPRHSGPRPSGPRSDGPRSSGQRPDGPRYGGPRPGGPRPDGPRSGGQRPDGPRYSGTRPGGPRPDGPRSSGPRPDGARSGGPRPGGRDFNREGERGQRPYSRPTDSGKFKSRQPRPPRPPGRGGRPPHGGRPDR